MYADVCYIINHNYYMRSNMTLELCMAPARHRSRLPHQSGSTNPSHCFLCACWRMDPKKTAGSFQTYLRRSCRLHIPTPVVFNSDAGWPGLLGPQPPDLSDQALKTCFHISCLSKISFCTHAWISTLNF